MDRPSPRDALATVTRGAAATRAIGEAVGALAAPGLLVLLRGPLGAGKTTLAQGIAAGLGIGEAVVSPTFVLVREYPGRGGRPDLWHADLYRVGSAIEAAELGLVDGLAGGAVVVVEWPEHGAERLAAEDELAIELAPLVGADDRGVALRARGAAARALLGAVAERLVGRPDVECVQP